MGKINFCKVVRRNLQDPTEPAKTYAVSQSRGNMNIDGLAKHMVKHNSIYSRGTIKGVLTDTVDCIRELICDGWIVNLGELGTFNVSLKSKGVAESVIDKDTKKKPVFTAANISGVELRFESGSAFDQLIDDCEFQEVEASDKQQDHLDEKKAAIAAGTWKPNENGSSTGGNGGNTTGGGGGTPNPDEGTEHE